MKDLVPSGESAPSPLPAAPQLTIRAIRGRIEISSASLLLSRCSPVEIISSICGVSLFSLK